MTLQNKKSVLDWVIILLIGVIPFGFALNPSSTVDLSVIRILIPLLFLVWLIARLIKRNLVIDTRLRSWLLVFVLFLSLSSVFWSINPIKAWRKVLFLGSIFPLYWIIFPFLKSKINFQLFLKIIFWSANVLSIIGLLQFFSQFIFGLDFVFQFQSKITPFFLGKNFSAMVLLYNSWLVNLGGFTIFRAIGLFPDPHLFSLFLNISLPVAFYLFNQSKNSKYLLGFCLILLTSLLTFSRAGYLSLFLALVFFWIFSIKKNNIYNLLLALLVLLFLLIPNPVNQRFYSILNFKESSISERLSLLKTGVEITKNNFWTGVGIGNLSETIQPLSDQRTPIYIHNLFLDFSTEIGFWGGLAIFLLILSPIISFLKKPTEKNFFIAMVFVIIMTHSMFETPFYSVRLLPLILSFLAI